MTDAAHIHDDDLELYSAGHLEPERISPLKAHLSRCPFCQERLYHCVGAKIGDGLAPRLERPVKHSSLELNHYCPKCLSSNVRRSFSRTLLDPVVRFFGRRPYCCRSCRLRFYLPSGRRTTSRLSIFKTESTGE
jgi:hypothetical protein